MTLLAAVAGVVLAAPFVLRAWTDWRYGKLVFRQAEETPARPVAIGFGALVWPDGRPSHMLADQVRAAASLYHAGASPRSIIRYKSRLFEVLSDHQAIRQFWVLISASICGII